MSYRWHCVINNYNEEETKIVELMKNSTDFWIANDIKYTFIRNHLDQKNETPHYHIYIEFQKRKGLRWINSLCGGRAHCEPARESRDINIHYIEKEDPVKNNYKPIRIIH